MLIPDVQDLEIETLCDEIKRDAHLLSLDVTTQIYRDICPALITDATSPEIGKPIMKALSKGVGFSAIRLGDGEANLLHFGTPSETPKLDLFAAVNSVYNQDDKFTLDENWLFTLRQMMLHSIHQADLFGVHGLWMANNYRTLETEGFLNGVRKDPRGMTGQWRARCLDRYINLHDVLPGKTIAPAHCYFGILSALSDIIESAKNVVCISARTEIITKLVNRHPEKKIELVELGRNEKDAYGFTNAPFLHNTMQALPRDLTGSLCLVGAGIWAEIYCSEIKSRGGVAVDIGSGFDLLDGMITRRVHRNLGPETMSKYSL